MPVLEGPRSSQADERALRKADSYFSSNEMNLLYLDVPLTTSLHNSIILDNFITTDATFRNKVFFRLAKTSLKCRQKTIKQMKLELRFSHAAAHLVITILFQSRRFSHFVLILAEWFYGRFVQQNVI